MNFDSFQFLIFIVLSLVSFHLARKTVFKTAVLSVINLIFLLSFVESWRELIPLLAFLLCGYGLLCLIRSISDGRVLAFFVFIVVILFSYLKQYSLINFFPSIPFSYLAIGLSYVLFRVIQLLVDSYDKAIKEEISPVDYFNFTCFFLNFVSGPIQRFQDFKKQEIAAKEAGLSEREVFNAFSRIATGYIKIIFLAPFFYNNPHPQYLEFNYVFSKLHGHSVLILSGWYIFAILSFMFKLYMNFSGYMDIVVGLGRLFFFNLPENFNRPFSAANFLDFWNRWHITLSEWFKIYLFNPILKIMMHRWNSPQMIPYLGVIAYFITFFVMGVWHGTTIIFVVYGLFLGLGVSVNKLYQILARKFLGKAQYNRLMENFLYKNLCRGLAGGYFAVALTCLWMSLDQFCSLFGKYSGVVLFAGFIGSGIFLSVLLYGWDSLVRWKEWGADKIASGTNPFVLGNLWLAVKVLFIAHLFLININPNPQFVYQAF